MDALEEEEEEEVLGVGGQFCSCGIVCFVSLDFACCRCHTNNTSLDISSKNSNHNHRV